MDLRELFVKVYNREIKEDDVIVRHIKDYGEEYDNFILNDGFDFWRYDGDGILSLNFFKNKNNENYTETFTIISKKEFEKRMEEIKKQNRIKELQAELDSLKGE